MYQVYLPGFKLDLHSRLFGNLAQTVCFWIPGLEKLLSSKFVHMYLCEPYFLIHILLFFEKKKVECTTYI